ncbi:MAG: DUF5681 domain-containing protein [Pseudomonadota bacterium]
MTSFDATQRKRADTYFKPGQSGNPKGRPRGSRSKLGEKFLAALHDDFEENGVEAIARVRKDKPEVYLKIIASILPKHLNLESKELSELSDSDLNNRIAGLVMELGISDLGELLSSIDDELTVVGAKKYAN